MSTKTLFLLIPVLLVVCITIMMVLYKKKHPYNARRRSREPFVSKNKRAVREEPVIANEVEEDIAEIDEQYTDNLSDGIISKPRVIQKNPFQQTYKQTENKPIIKETYEINSQQTPAATETADLIILGLKSNAAHPYTGYELLQALLTAGLRFGKMNIFHRHEEISGKGNILFSLASAAEPGTFELNKMGAFSTPGLMLFMRVSQVKDPVTTFDLMCTVAQQLTDDLGGEILDAERKPLTEEKITSLRHALISSFSHNQTADLFAPDA